MDWIARHRRLALAIICAVWVGVVVVALRLPRLPFLSAVPRAEQSFEDLLRREGRRTPTRADFVFLGIDQQTLQINDVVEQDELASSRALQLMAERAYPWSREVWALLLDRLFAAGARVVVFDIIFNPPNDGDPLFADALNRYQDRVVIGVNYDGHRGMLITPNATLIPAPAEQDDRVGLVNFWPDVDGRVRAAQFIYAERQLAGGEATRGDPQIGALDARTLAKFGREADIPQEFRRYPIRFSAANAYEPRPLWEVFSDRLWAANYKDGAFFKDKVVIVGASAQIMHDVVDTPLGPNTHGAALHLHVTAAALAHEFLSYPPVWVGWVSLLLAGFAAWIVVALGRRPLFDIAALVAIAIGYLFLARFFYDTRGIFLLTVPVLVAFVGSGGSSLGCDYILERREKLRTRRTLERYVSKNLVVEILDNPASFYNSMRGARKPATMLFSDIVGFTSMTESADPVQLVTQLNEYLSRMVGVVFENGGTLDKFIGDAVMAVWGNVSSRGVAQDAKAAARTALGMRRELKVLNERWHSDGTVPLAIGVGINQGDVLIGNIGSSGAHERLDPTVIGDAVNLASRLEGLTRTYGVDVLIGPTASELIRDEFHLRTVARVQVKGRSEPVEVTTLIGARDDTISEELLRALEWYEEGVRRFREREWAPAKALFTRFLEFSPADYLAKTYLERSLHYEAQPPEEGWTAAEVFTTK
jgi:adenylate cyclase